MFKKILKPILPPAIVFTFHILMIAIFRIYTHFPAFDIPMHFLGGLSIGISAIILLNIFKTKINAPKFFIFVWIIGLTVLMATLWEFAEFIGDYYFQTQMQISLADTMADMFLGLAGGTVAGVYRILHHD